MDNSYKSRKFTGNKMSKRRESKGWFDLQQSLMDKRNERLVEKQKTDEIRSTVYPSIMMEITYCAEIESHSGYCSDPDDNIEIIHRTRKEIVGLPTIFKKGDIYVNGFNTRSINPTNVKLLKLFAKDDVPCDKGSGYCGCKTKFSIKEAKVYHYANVDPNANISESDFL